MSLPNAKYTSCSVALALHPAMHVVKLYPAAVLLSKAPPSATKLYENKLFCGGKRDTAMPVPSVSLQICCCSCRATTYSLAEIQEPEIRWAFPLFGYTMSRASVVSATLLRVIFCDATKTTMRTVPADGLSVDVAKRSVSSLACSKVF